jgi:hypothetical protein
MGIETAKQELDMVREAVNQLSSGMQILSTEVAVEQKIEPQSAETEVSEPKVEVVEEKLPEPPIERVEVKETDSFQAQQENKQETSQSTEESQSTETVAEGGEKQET